MYKALYAYAHPYVFLAIEFGNNFNGGETRVLGVYTTRETAENKIRKHIYRKIHPYNNTDLFNKTRERYGIIKKTIEGRRF